jgi:hypothetical protein
VSRTIRSRQQPPSRAVDHLWKLEHHHCRLHPSPAAVPEPGRCPHYAYGTIQSSIRSEAGGAGSTAGARPRRRSLSLVVRATRVVENNTVATERDPPSLPKGGVFRSGGTRPVVAADRQRTRQSASLQRPSKSTLTEQQAFDCARLQFVCSSFQYPGWRCFRFASAEVCVTMRGR